MIGLGGMTEAAIDEAHQEQARQAIIAKSLTDCVYCKLHSASTACSCKAQCSYRECLAGQWSFVSMPGHIHDEVPFPRFLP